MDEQDKNKPKAALKELDPDHNGDLSIFHEFDEASDTEIFHAPDYTGVHEWDDDEVQMDIPPNDIFDDEPLDRHDDDLSFMDDDEIPEPDPVPEGPPIVLAPEANADNPPDQFNVFVEGSEAPEQSAPFTYASDQDRQQHDSEQPPLADQHSDESTSYDQASSDREKPSEKFRDLPANVKTANDNAGTTDATQNLKDDVGATTIPSRRRIAEAAARAPFSGMTEDSKQNLKASLSALETLTNEAEANILRAQRSSPQDENFNAYLNNAESSISDFDKSLNALASQEFTYSKFVKPQKTSTDKNLNPDELAYRDESKSKSFENTEIRDLLHNLNVKTVEPDHPNGKSSYQIDPEVSVKSGAEVNPEARLKNLQEKSLPRIAIAKQKIAKLKKQLEDEDDLTDEYVDNPQSLLDSIIFNIPNKHRGGGSFLGAIMQDHRERQALNDFDTLKDSAQNLIDQNYRAARTSLAVNGLVDDYYSAVPESDRCNAALDGYVRDRLASGNDKKLQTLLDEGYDAGRISSLAQQRIASQASVYEFNQALSNYQLLHANDVDRDAAFARAMNDPAHGKELQRQYHLLNEHEIPEYEKQFIKESRAATNKYITDQSAYSMKADKADVDLADGLKNLNKIVNTQIITPPKTKNIDANEMADLGKRLGEMFSRIFASLGLKG